jgi:hypothetical protein
LSNPFEYIQILFNTISNINLVTFDSFSFIGILGWLDTPLPSYIYYIFFAILFLITLLDYSEHILITIKQKAIIFLILIATILCIYTSLYIVWTPVGQNWIEGIHGRYFIPVSPLFFLLLYINKRMINEKLLDYFKVICTTILICILFITTHAIFIRYYSSAIPVLMLLGLTIGITITQLIVFRYIQIKEENEKRYKKINSFTNTKSENSNTLVGIFGISLIFSMILISVISLFSIGSVLGISQQISNQPVGEISGGTTIGQTFYSTLPNLNSIDIDLATYGRSNTKDVIFHLRERPESKNDIVTLQINAQKISNNAYYTFKFPIIKDSVNKSYYFFLESPTSVPGNAITIWSSKDDVYPDGSLYVNSNPVPGDLAFKVYYESVYGLL